MSRGPSHCSRCRQLGHVVTKCTTPAIEVARAFAGMLAPAPRTRVRRRRTRPRAVTIATKHLTRAVRRAAELETPPVAAELQRPQVRGECGTERPCPWVTCKHNLYLDINPETGSIKLNFPNLEPWEMGDASCAIDVAERGDHTLEEVGEVMNLTCERMRQIEVRALLKLKFAATDDGDLAPVTAAAVRDVRAAEWSAPADVVDDAPTPSPSTN